MESSEDFCEKKIYIIVSDLDLISLTSLLVDDVDGLYEEQGVTLGVLNEDKKQLERRLHHQSKLKHSQYLIVIFNLFAASLSKLMSDVSICLELQICRSRSKRRNRFDKLAPKYV